MATSTDDLQNFLENLLQGFDPTVDLSPGSPAQTKVIAPILSRISLDPLDTDLSTFIKDRFVQEFPDLAADGGGLLEDVLSKPLQLLLEPFKREVNVVKLDQSVQNAELMADEEADALGANWFEDREQGNTASTTVRLFFAAPTTVSVTTEKRCFTNSGLNYFPIENFLISSSLMLFNRQGNLFYMDIVVQAEQPGTDYNVKAGEISGIDNVPGVVKVANLTDITDGAPREDNATYLGRIETALTERSLVVKRGLGARIPKLFDGVRALQVVGAGEVGMDRDILKGSSEGFLHLAGDAIVYGDWILLSVTYRDKGANGDIIVQPGDLIRFQNGGTDDIYEARVSTVLSLSVSPDKVFILLDQAMMPGVPGIIPGPYALFKPGFITISEVPGGLLATTVPDGEVHLGGHTDLLIRPTSDIQQTAVLPNITDDSPVMALLAVTVTANSNKIDVNTAVTGKVSIGDLLVIETGAAAGTYRILSVGSPDGGDEIRVDSILAATENNLRARVIHSPHVNLIEPRVPKLPFNTGSVSDLRTTVGSTLFRFDSTNIASFGGKVGDTIRVLDGPDAGDFIITAFDLILGGQGAIVDRAAGASGAGLRYEVFTPSTGLTRPLVRLKALEILDSTGQGTGITVPYGDAVDARPTCDFDGAGQDVRVLDREVFIFPDASGIWPIASDAGSFGQNTDSRYSQNLVPADGFTKYLAMDASNPITSVEVNFPPFLWNGKKDKLLAFVTRKDLNFTTDPTGTHWTSDIAEAKVGDSIVLLDGPNEGKYLIKDLRILDLWGVNTGQHGHYKTALVQVEPEFKVDPVRTGMNFIVDDGSQPAVNSADLLKIVRYASDFRNASGFYLPYLTKLGAAFTNSGFAGVAGALVTEVFDRLAFSGYDVGPSARGVLRNYFIEPVSVEYSYGNSPTKFQDSLNPTRVFRPDLFLPPAQVFPESETPTTPDQWLRNESLRDPPGTDVFLTSGSPFAKKGVETGDLFEFYPAVNDLPSRKNMSSSWLCITQEGSNVVKAILPQHPDNRTTVIPGQLFFIDSGPDTGAYTITGVTASNFGVSPPSVVFTLDRVLSHSTLLMPATPFASSKAQVQSLGNVFPMGALAGKTLKVQFSTDGGVTLTTRTHTFGAGPFNAIADVVNDINGDAVFLGGGPDLEVAAGDDELFVRTNTSSFNTVLVVDPTSTCRTGGLLMTLKDVGRGDSAILVGGTMKAYHSTFTVANVGDWITFYAAQSPGLLSAGEDAAYLGSFQVMAKGTEGGGVYINQSFVTLDRSANFPAGVAIGRYVIHARPDTVPADTTGGGRLISDQYVRFRMYDSVAQRRTITIPWTTASVNPISSSSEEQITLDASLASTGYGHKDPYRVIRVGVKRVSSTAMSLHREGALYYVDVPVVGYGPGAEMNVPEGTSFFIVSGAKIEGYVLEVENNIFSFSTEEQVAIRLPNSVLPVGSSPDLDNFISLSGQSLQIIYDNAPLVQEIQNFINAPLDRVTSANLLARHFLPSYVFLDVSYFGGSDESVVAKDLIAFINGIAPDNNQLRADAVQDLVKRRGATNVTLPIVLVSLTHGADRRIRGLRSQNSIGGETGAAPFSGTFKQMYFIAGPDTSLETTRPNGEQIFLKRA